MLAAVFVITCQKPSYATVWYRNMPISLTSY